MSKHNTVHSIRGHLQKISPLIEVLRLAKTPANDRLPCTHTCIAYSNSNNSPGLGRVFVGIIFVVGYDVRWNIDRIILLHVSPMPQFSEEKVRNCMRPSCFGNLLLALVKYISPPIYPTKREREVGQSCRSILSCKNQLGQETMMEERPCFILQGSGSSNLESIREFSLW